MSVRSTVVFTDLHGSTAVFGALGNVRATAAITHITSWIASLCGTHRGRLVKTLGDGVMVVFPDNMDAIEFVLDVQRTHFRQSARMPGEVRLPIRIGLACGDLEVLSGDCYGDAVNVAARLCDLCGPAQIWASSSVVDSTDKRLIPNLRALGPIHIRGRQEACDVYQLEWREEEPSDFLTMQAGLVADGPTPKDILGKEVTLSLGAYQATFKSFELPIHIGRVKNAEFVVSDPRVSRTHAKLEWRNGGIILVDLSTYGTAVRFANDHKGDLLLRRDECVLHGRGSISLAGSFADDAVPSIQFEVN